MTHRLSIRLAAFLLLLGVGLAMVRTDAAAPATYIDGQVVVLPRDVTAVNALHAAGYATVSSLSTGYHLMTIRPGISVPDAVAELLGRGDLISVQPNLTARILLTPNDPNFTGQNHLALIDAANAWDITIGQSTDTIAIIDTGGDSTHLDILSRVVFAAGTDILNGDTDASEPVSGTGHATNVASLAAATTNNAYLVAGVDWNAKVLFVRCMSTDGTGSWYDIAKGILKAVEHKATVINLSLGTDTTTIIDVAEDALIAARNAGIPVICAAGNSGAAGTPVGYPASSRQSIAVGSSTAGDVRASTSSYGTPATGLHGVDLVAPGDSVMFLSAGAGTTTGSGTSFAAPLVSGAVSLLHSLRAEYTPANYRTLLTATTKDLATAGYDSGTGWGRLDLLTLLRQSRVNTLFPFSNDSSAIRADTFSTDPVGNERTAVTVAGGRQGRRYLAITGDDVYAGYVNVLAADTGSLEFYFRYASLQSSETRYIATQRGNAVKAKGNLDLVLLSDSRVQFNLQDSGVVTSQSRLNPNQWYHLAVSWGSKGMILYVNGESEASRTTVGGPPIADTVYLGVPAALGSAKSARGSFDALRFSNTQRVCFPSALAARFDNITSQAIDAVNVRWTALKNETSPVTVNVYVDEDSVGFDGHLIASTLANDGAEAISLTSLAAFGKQYYLYIEATDVWYPTEVARAYSDTPFTAFSSLVSLVKSPRPESNKVCVIAHVAGDHDVNIFRAFRDLLLENALGRFFVRCYYLFFAW